MDEQTHKPTTNKFIYSMPNEPVLNEKNRANEAPGTKKKVTAVKYKDLLLKPSILPEILYITSETPQHPRGNVATPSSPIIRVRTPSQSQKHEEASCDAPKPHREM